MGGNGAGGGAGLLRASGRAAGRDRDLCQQLRSGGSDRLLREKIRFAEGDQQSSKLLVLGAPGLHRRKRPCVRQRWDRRSRTLRERGGSRTYRSPLFAPRRTLRDFSLPRLERASVRAVAEDEEVGLGGLRDGAHDPPTCMRGD